MCLKQFAAAVLVAGLALTPAGHAAGPLPAVSSVTQPEAATPISKTSTHVLDKNDLEAWLDGYVPFALKGGDIAGMVIVVVKDGTVLLQKGYGYADLARKLPMDPQTTLIRPGSTSKLFTWTAVMQLVEQHKLDLDRDVNVYLDFKIPSKAGRKSVV